METITGTVATVTCLKDGWGCGTLRLQDATQPLRFTGDFLHLYPGQRLQLSGEYIVHKTYGKQFKAESSYELPPQDYNGLVKFLSSKQFKGIGPKLASRIVNYFGTNDTLTVLKEEPERLQELALSSKKREAIEKGLSLFNQVIELQEICGSVLTITQCRKIINHFKEHTVDILKTNPYQLIEINGFGFRIVDHIALSMGIANDSVMRVDAGIDFIMQTEGEFDGHVFQYIGEITPRIIEILFPGEDPLLRKDLIVERIKALIEQEVLVLDRHNNRPILYRAATYRQECICSSIIAELSTSPSFFLQSQKDIRKHIGQYETQNNIQFNNEQREAVVRSLSNRISVITGGAGTGKTTVLDVILTAWDQYMAPNTIILCAPTGKAAQRMSETTGLPATTVHRLIAQDKTLDPHKKYLFVMDETSMLDLPLAAQTLQYFHQCQILFIGDYNQLPSVGIGAFLQNLIQHEDIATSQLIHTVRNSGNIKSNANNINQGLSMSAFTYGDDFCFKSVERANQLTAVMDEYRLYMNDYAPKDIIILCCQKTRGDACVVNCNKAVQELVNPHGERVLGTSFRVGDRIMVTTNMHKKVGYDEHRERIEGVFNGNCGTIAYYNMEDECITVHMDNNTTFEFDIDDFSALTLAYAMTVHKSQGSEYPIVIMPFNMQHYLMLKRNILYTGITRAKKHISILGEAKAVNMAIRDTKYNERNSLLKERISAERAAYTTEITLV